MGNTWSNKGGAFFKEARIGWRRCHSQQGFQWPGLTLLLGDSLLVAWSSAPPGNHTNFKERLLSIFCREGYSVYFKPEIFSDSSHSEAAPRCQNRRRRHRVTSQPSVVLISLSVSPVSLSVFSSVCFSFTLPLSVSCFSLFTANSAGIRTLLSKYIQSNLITAITFLLGWLTVLSVPLNAAALLLYIPKLLIPPQPQPHFHGSFGSPIHLSSFFSLLFPLFLSFLLRLFLVYFPGYLASSHLSWFTHLILFSLLVLFLSFSFCLLFSFHPRCFFFTTLSHSHSFSKANRIFGQFSHLFWAICCLIRP